MGQRPSCCYRQYIYKKVVTNCFIMSVVKRISEEAEEYVSNNKKKHESWMEAHDRLLGLDEPPLTEERVEEIVEEKIEELRRR